jgi:hypothetical protein
MSPATTLRAPMAAHTSEKITHAWMIALRKQ